MHIIIYHYYYVGAMTESVQINQQKFGSGKNIYISITLGPLLTLLSA